MLLGNLLLGNPLLGNLLLGNPLLGNMLTINNHFTGSSITMTSWTGSRDTQEKHCSNVSSKHHLSIPFIWESHLWCSGPWCSKASERFSSGPTRISRLSKACTSLGTCDFSPPYKWAEGWGWVRRQARRCWLWVLSCWRPAIRQTSARAITRWTWPGKTTTDDII